MKTKLFVFLFVLVLISCSSSVEPLEVDMPMEVQELLEQPVSPIDYSMLDNWIFHPDQPLHLLEAYDLDIGIVDKDLQLEGSIQIENNAKVNTGVDVFFVHPTLLENAPSEAMVIPIEDQPITRIDLTVLAQGGQLAKYGRFFAPHYRQSTGATYLESDLDKTLQAEVIMQSYSDVKAAFLDYVARYNNGNKIILAGHSQGSYLLSMLVRDLFDEDIELRNKLITAALGGMGHVYARTGEDRGGQFRNIPLCQESEECGCVQSWRSYEEGQAYGDLRTTLPMFNPELVRYGVFYREADLNTDRFLMDESEITQNQEYVRYIALSANVNEDHGFNFVAHDNLYLARIRRDSNTEIGLNITYQPEMGDQRINDLALEQANPLFDFWGYHTKDYATYLWPLLEQIDAKIAQCN